MKKRFIFFDSNLEYLFESKKIQQTAASIQLNVSKSTLNNWIKGKATPNYTDLCNVADLLNVNLDDLIRKNLRQSSIIIDNQEILNTAKESEIIYKAVNTEGVSNLKIELIETDKQLYEKVITAQRETIEALKEQIELLKKGIS